MFTLLATSFALTNSVALPAKAQAEHPPAPECEMKMNCPTECESWPEKLELTDNQMEKIIDIKTNYEIKTAPQKAQLMANMKQMALLMTSEKSNNDQILSINEKINSLRTDLEKARVQKMMDVMDVMTPQQKAKLHHEILIHMLNFHQAEHFGHHFMHHEMHHELHPSK